MTESQRHQVICLTPNRNESWILDRFLAAASLWADRIIVADQRSDDGCLDIIARHPKAELVVNDRRDLDENQRQNLLIAAARRHPGPKLLIALDADEFLSATVFESEEWRRALTAPPGTVLTFDWPLLFPGFTDYRLYAEGVAKPFAMVDDGRPHQVAVIHSHRLPYPADGPTIAFSDVVVMHFQATNPRRMRSKNRWYQCWEMINLGKPAPWLFRHYMTYMDVLRQADARVPPAWFAGYRERGVDLTVAAAEPELLWQDHEVAAMLARHGAARFAQLNIWEVDWVDAGRRLGIERPERLADPRSPVLRLYQAWRLSTYDGRRRHRLINSVLRRLAYAWPLSP